MNEGVLFNSAGMMNLRWGYHVSISCDNVVDAVESNHQ